MRILGAEDDTVSRVILRKHIEREGHLCYVADCGESAWALFQANLIDVVISDWMMPGLSGPELCRRVRGAPDRGYTYFILLTSLDDRTHRKDGMLAGADDYLTKPLDREDLQLRLMAADRVIVSEDGLAVMSADERSLDPMSRT